MCRQRAGAIPSDSFVRFGFLKKALLVCPPPHTRNRSVPPYLGNQPTFASWVLFFPYPGQKRVWEKCFPLPDLGFLCTSLEASAEDRCPREALYREILVLFAFLSSRCFLLSFSSSLLFIWDTPLSHCPWVSPENGTLEEDGRDSRIGDAGCKMLATPGASSGEAEERKIKREGFACSSTTTSSQEKYH